MNNTIIRPGQYEGQTIASIKDKTFLIQYRTKYQSKMKGIEKLAVNQRIRELHKLTPA